MSNPENLHPPDRNLSVGENLYLTEPVFEFGTKGETLARLAGRLTRGHLPEQVLFEVGEWNTRHRAITERLVEFAAGRLLAIRSSALGEDGPSESKAGEYESVINVSPEPENIADAVGRVIRSYRSAQDGDQVLVQAMIPEVAVSGVLTTRDIGDGGPYYVVNYDDESGETDSVTGGREGKSIFVRRSQRSSPRSRRFRHLLQAVSEIEAETSSTELDVEFCISKDEAVHILQVRRLTLQQSWVHPSDEGLDMRLEEVKERIGATQGPVAGLFGRRAVFGEMSDWNPAEMIGMTPKPLALSLYRSLITDTAWSRGRAKMGYQDLGDTPLLTVFCGRPFIDLRKTFNSLLPAGLDEDIGHALIDYQVADLANRPDLHDKVEFEISLSCRDPEFSEARSRLRKDVGLCEHHATTFEQRLLQLTRGQVEGGGVILEDPLTRTRLLAADPRGSGHSLPEMLDRCRSEGTVPFAMLARHGFIAVSFLRSLVRAGVLKEERADAFMSSIRTVAGDIVNDMVRVAIGKLEQSEFLGTYGHLRPGTYDITSFRYDERPDLYLNGEVLRQTETRAFVPSQAERVDIEKLLGSEGFQMSAEELFSYIEKAVAAREEAKFHFTKSVSQVLRDICDLGESLGIDRADLAYLHINDILRGPDRARWNDAISQASGEHRYTRSVRFPHLVTSEDDVDVVRFPLGRPTFITHKSVIAPSVFLGANERGSIDDKIVMIESADPGFDWIFAREVVGLVTMFGGANSHMAIRCAEFGIPAAIGCGARRFADLQNASRIEIDCAAQILRSPGR